MSLKLGVKVERKTEELSDSQFKKESDLHGPFQYTSCKGDRDRGQ